MRTPINAADGVRSLEREAGCETGCEFTLIINQPER